MKIQSAVGFEWDQTKDVLNQFKHGVSFSEAQKAFADKHRIILEDEEHSHHEDRYYCLGKADDTVLTVRFTFRGDNIIRIIGAGYWRKGRKIYEEKKNSLHR